VGEALAIACAATLAPAALAAARVGLFGGSFDPVHRGHLHAARAARAARRLEHVVFVPAAAPPHKPEAILAPGAARAHLLRLALSEERAGGWASVWTVELERPGASYTVDTLRELARAREAAGRAGGIALVIGDDNLAGFPRWREAAELFRLAEVLVVRRLGTGLGPGASLERTLRLEVERAAGPEAARVLERGIVDAPVVEASATEIRARLARGERGLRELHEAVAEYALERRLYASERP
jgi:nicotinate-nucleotide adenylyltransferase